jgi:pilus assembly protein CpaE
MIKFALQSTEAPPEPAADATRAEHIAPVPRVSIQAFCESAETAAAMQAAAEDRRMVKAHLKVQMGGVAAAAEAYRGSPTPNVVVLESEGRGPELLAGLDALSEVCDAGTRVIVIARVNDIQFYRELVRRQISDYLLAPIEVVDSSARSPACFRRPMRSPWAVPWLWSAPRAGWAPRPLRTISAGRSRATSNSMPW